MRITFTFRNLEPSENIKIYASEKIARMQKYLRAPLEGTVIVSLEGHLHCVDVTVSADGKRYAAREESEGMYASIDLALDKIDRQVREAKANVTRKRRHSNGNVSIGKNG